MNCVQLFPNIQLTQRFVAKDQAAMTLKLMLAVYCAVVAFAASPGKQGTAITFSLHVTSYNKIHNFVSAEFFDNKEETTAQEVCDDPCLLCTLLQDYVEQVKGIKFYKQLDSVAIAASWLYIATYYRQD